MQRSDRVWEMTDRLKNHHDASYLLFVLSFVTVLLCELGQKWFCLWVSWLFRLSYRINSLITGQLLGCRWLFIPLLENTFEESASVVLWTAYCECICPSDVFKSQSDTGKYSGPQMWSCLILYLCKGNFVGHSIVGAENKTDCIWILSPYPRQELILWL